MLKKYFKISALSQKKKPKLACPRWWPMPNKNEVSPATEHIEKHMPSSIRLYTDEANGRWRIISGDMQNRSISWTARGLARAAAETIHMAWSYHLDAHPQDAPPFDLNELANHGGSSGA